MTLVALGATSAFLAVALGAFGAHALRDRLTPDLLAVFETGARYQLIHAVALVALGFGQARLAAARGVGLLFVLGSILFSGSLYALALTGTRAFGAVTPLGGLAFLAGWAWLAVAAFAAARRGAVAALLLLMLAGGGCAGGGGAPAAADTSDAFVPAQGLALVEVARGFDRPLYVTAPAGDARLFVVEQGGKIRIVKDGKVVARPFLDLSAKTRASGERGLLSMAFHPRYASNGFFFVNYTDTKGDTRVERYTVTKDPDVADPASAALVLAVDQPYVNHNGGHVLFGPDGRLYVGMGDGGAGGDPHGNGQNPRALLGKLLRIDVDAPAPKPEIWALGLRNPWRFAFDAPSGLLYIADVGQDRWEEIDVVPLARSGLNYGWNLTEGKHDYKPDGRSSRGMIVPLVEYSHDAGCSITGGFVYRGHAVPGMAGTYFFSDYGTGFLRSFRVRGGRAIERRQWEGIEAGSVTSFGLDAAGELYVTNSQGQVLRLAPASRPGG
jgi:uncharacterized membrane protein YgdD (TMEM256/DUF423 family)